MKFEDLIKEFDEKFDVDYEKTGSFTTTDEYWADLLDLLRDFVKRTCDPGMEEVAILGEDDRMCSVCQRDIKTKKSA